MNECDKPGRPREWLASQEVIDWRSAAGDPRLGRQEMHVWWVRLDVSEARVDELSGYLSRGEHKRAGRLRSARHRRRYIVGRGLLRELISRYIDGNPATHCFQFGPLGKPSLPAGTGSLELCFNYTDSADRGLFAFAWARELGVDLECLDRDVLFERISARKFTSVEHRALMALSDNLRRAAFLACWTRKEGFGKAKGVGIRYPLNSVSLCEDCIDPHLEIADAGTRWNLKQIYPASNFVGSLVYHGTGLSMHYFALNAQM